MKPTAAGIDIGATEIYVAVHPDRDPQPVRSFAPFTEDLHRLADGQCSNSVALEATGVYWIPLFQILKAHGFEVCLVKTKASPSGHAEHSDFTGGIPIEIAIHYGGEERVVVISSDGNGRGASVSGKDAFFASLPTGTKKLQVRGDAGGRITALYVNDEKQPAAIPPGTTNMEVTATYRTDPSLSANDSVLKIFSGIALLAAGAAFVSWLLNEQKPDFRRPLADK